MPIKNRIGHRYGMLTVSSFAGLNYRFQANWNCICDCGAECVVFGGNLNSEHTASCGCNKGLLKHGENRIGHRSVEYQTFAGMLNRCNNPNFKGYHLYGGRGIKVCDEWNSFDQYPEFLAYVGRRPTPKHSIDRWPDKNGDYRPGNVRWATIMEQQSNTRKNVFIKVKGESIHLAEAARRHNIAPAKLGYRLKHGWSVEEALSL